MQKLLIQIYKDILKLFNFNLKWQNSTTDVTIMLPSFYPIYLSLRWLIMIITYII